MNNFKGAAKRIDDVDLPKLGRLIGVGEDELHAFMDVETSGSGFDVQGRPKMLFEPHVFYRNLPDTLKAVAVREGLAYAKQGARAYPKDSYPRLIKAIAIHQTAALKAASWGLGQILGENHKMIGYPTPEAMVVAFMADEENQLKGVIDYLVAAKLAKPLRDHAWAVVARGYNGPAYKINNYDKKMAMAFAKWRKIRDTPIDKDAPPEKPTPAPITPKASPVAVAPQPVTDSEAYPDYTHAAPQTPPPIPPPPRGLLSALIAFLSYIFGKGLK